MRSIARTRRQFFKDCGVGVGSLALLSLLATTAVAQTVDVQQYWTSASESKAMNAIADAYKARGGKWIDSPSADFDSAIAAADCSCPGARKGLISPLPSAAFSASV